MKNVRKERSERWQKLMITTALKVFSLLFLLSCGEDKVTFRDVPYEAPTDYEQPKADVPLPEDPLNQQRPKPKPIPTDPPEQPEPTEPTEPEPPTDPEPVDPEFPVLESKDFYYQGDEDGLHKWPYCHLLPDDYWQEAKHQDWGLVTIIPFCQFYEIVINDGLGCSCRHR